MKPIGLILLVCTHAETVNLFLCEVTPVATTEVLLSETCKLYAVELGHLIAERLEDTAYDTVLTAMDLNAHLLLVDRIGA